MLGGFWENKRKTVGRLLQPCELQTFLPKKCFEKELFFLQKAIKPTMFYFTMYTGGIFVLGGHGIY